MTSTTIMMCTFADLATATESLHLGDRAHLDRLHDVWKLGAVTPDSVVHSHEYLGLDERQNQRHARVRRIVLPSKLAEWMVDVSKARGMPYTYAQACNIACGRADYGMGAEG